MDKFQVEWTSRYEGKGALWIHDGKVKRPHALLTSGKHSGGFFNSELVMEDACLLDEACNDLISKLADSGLRELDVSRVVGPAMGAITLAHSLASLMVSLHSPCLRAYVEKEENGMRMVFKRTTIKPGEKILLCEDVITTAGSVKKAAQAVKEAGGILLPFVAALVNRSGLVEVDGMKIVALIDRPMPMWEASECPLCKQGSEAIHAKTPAENWVRLNAEY